MTQICNEVPSLRLACVKSAVSRLNKKRCEPARNKHHYQLESLFKESFFPQQSPLKQLVPVNSAVEPDKQQPKAGTKLSVRNVNKKLRRRDDKIKQYKSDIADLSKENKVLQDRLASAQRVGEQNRVTVYRMNQKKEMVSDKTMHLESRLQDL